MCLHKKEKQEDYGLSQFRIIKFYNPRCKHRQRPAPGLVDMGEAQPGPECFVKLRSL